MNACLKKGTIAFRPRARLLKLIGEELISDEVVALSELVKNAHDADATLVTVSFLSVTGPEGRVEVCDDGHGMTLDTLLGRWMEPAASTKVGKGQQVTRRGRRVLGEKGVGRFAADKLARRLEIVTRCRKHREETAAVIDWDKYDVPDSMLSDIENCWELRPARDIQEHGTLLRLTGLRSVWSERTFRRLSLRLSRLLSPFREKDEFRIHIQSDDFPEYSGEVRADFMDKAPYRIEAEFDGLQTIALSINGKSAVRQRWNGQGELSCGPVRIRLYVFDLEGEAIAKIGPRMELRAWLREWTGVSVYRDGFRVWPYGEPYDDWLRLDQRRVNNPVERLSNNQVIGFIDIGRDANPGLMDQTNREGLIHNQPFEDLRRLVYFVLQAIEAERQSIRHPVRRVPVAVRASQTEASSIAEELQRLATDVGGNVGRQLRTLSTRVESRAACDALVQRETAEAYASLAASGQMAMGLMPLIPDALERMREAFAGLGGVLARGRVPEARAALAGLEETMRGIDECCRLMLAGSLGTDRRRAIDVISEVHRFRTLVDPVLARRCVPMEIVCERDGVLRAEMRPEHFHCLLQILMTNSLDWLGRTEAPRIRVSLSQRDGLVELIFSDNGPGIPPEMATQLFNPLVTRKEGGRGMGLTIARELIESHGGNIQLLVDGRRRGANFQILLPRKRPRATIYGRS